MKATGMTSQGTHKSEDQMQMAGQFLQMATGYWVSQAIYVGAKLGIADLLKDGPKSVDNLATSVQAQPRFLYRVMRALASLGIFVELEDGRFDMTPLAEFIQTDAPGSMRALVITLCEEHYRAWGELLHSVKTGQTAFDHLYGKGVFDYFAENPESAEIFNQAMTSFANQMHLSVLSAYDFSPIKKIVDVGGGHGALITSILKSYPQMSGILFDSPQVIEGAGKHIEAAGLSSRCELAGGNFFESIPEGGDAYILSHIIHDWNDDHSRVILEKCHRAMADNAKLLLVEEVVPPGNEPSLSKLMDLNMMAVAGGRERTEAEFRDLLEAAGFKLARIVNTQSPMKVIEGIRL